MAVIKAATAPLRYLDDQIHAYLKGTLKVFDLTSLGISKDLHELGGTPLQRKVWRELRAIPYGNTISYAALAARVSKPKAVRAVASAVAANPLLIIVPCHRVVPSRPKRKGDIGGYSGGVEMKRHLLNLEKMI